MSVELREDAGGKVFVAKLTGKLTKDDYQQFVPEVERLIRQHGKVRMLVEMHGFHGWTAGALWEDIKFDWKHFGDIERLALIGEASGRQAWRRSASRSLAPRSAFLTRPRPGEAINWLKEGIAQPVAS